MKEIQTVDGYIVQVDDDDYELLSLFEWMSMRGKKTKYARTGVSDLMHRVLASKKYKRLILAGEQVDHRDGNGLNNQKDNLRICTQALNNHNQTKMAGEYTSQYKGVSYHSRDSKWISCFQNDFEINKAYFNNEMDAALYYDKMVKELYSKGEITSQMLNFPDHDGDYPEYKKQQGVNSKLYHWVEHYQRWTFEIGIIVDGKKKRHTRGFRTEEDCIAYRNKYVVDNNLDYILL